MSRTPQHDGSDRGLEDIVRRALHPGVPTRPDRATRDRIAARLGIEIPGARRWPWLVGSVAAAAMVGLAIIVSQVRPPPIAREATPTPAAPSQSAAPGSSPGTDTPVPGRAFGALPEPEFARTAGDIDPAGLRFSLAPGTHLPEQPDALVGQVEFVDLSESEAQVIAARLGFVGPPTEAHYGRTTAWAWRDGPRSLSVEDAGSIEYGDPTGSAPALDVSDAAGAAREWLAEAFGADSGRLARNPLLREIGDGRLQVNFNPPPQGEAEGLDYYRRPGSGAFPYASVTLLPDGTIQQASYRDAAVTESSSYPLRSGLQILGLLRSGTYPVRAELPEAPPSVSGEAAVESVRIGYQLVSDSAGAAYLVPVFRVTGTLMPDTGADQPIGWSASLPALDPHWTRGD